MKEVLNHTKHLEVTFDKLLSLLFTDEEFNLICLAKEDAASLFSQRSAWIKTSDLVREGVTTENMALIGVARPNCTNVSISTCDGQMPTKFAQ